MAARVRLRKLLLCSSQPALQPPEIGKEHCQDHAVAERETDEHLLMSHACCVQPSDEGGEYLGGTGGRQDFRGRRWNGKVHENEAHDDEYEVHDHRRTDGLHRCCVPGWWKMMQSSIVADES
jgi:hypothetical protein